MLRDHSFDLLSGKVTIEEAHPMQPRWVAEEVAARSYFAASFANVTAFETDAGLVRGGAKSDLRGSSQGRAVADGQGRVFVRGPLTEPIYCLTRPVGDKTEQWSSASQAS